LNKRDHRMQIVLAILKGYVATIAVETPLLCLWLSPRHSFTRKVLAGLWLTACSYPIVVLTIPRFISPSSSMVRYMITAETAAVLLEVVLFFAAFDGACVAGERSSRSDRFRDCSAIIGANACSFLAGEFLIRSGLW
jgi:hypothetical protein